MATLDAKDGSRGFASVTRSHVLKFGPGFSDEERVFAHELRTVSEWLNASHDSGPGAENDDHNPPRIAPPCSTSHFTIVVCS
jgi:hypothetical protein